MNLTSLNKIITDSIEFVERKEYVSYDVFDAMTNPIIDKLTTKQIILRRIITQINAKLLFNFRFLGMIKMVHTKTVSDMLSVYSLLFKQTHEGKYFVRAQNMFKILMDKKISTENGIGWGLNFKYTTRFTNAAESTPNIYNIVNSANAFLDFFEISEKNEIKEIFGMILRFIETELGSIEIDNNTICYRYYPNLEIHAHNVNALLAALFVRINIVFNDKIIPQSKIEKIINFLKINQNEDGSWYYTDDEKGKWVDGFHTGFILESLSFIHYSSRQYDLYNVIEKGMSFYKQKLFTMDGIPLYYPNKLFPIESQNCAQAIQTIANCSIYLNSSENDFMLKIISKVIDALYNQKGFFYYKKNKYMVNKNIYLRWSQTPMILALIYSNNCLTNYV